MPARFPANSGLFRRPHGQRHLAGDGRDQFFEVEGLAQDLCLEQVALPNEIGFVKRPGHENDLDVAVALLLPETGADSQPVLGPEVNVEKNDVRPFNVEAFEHLGGVCCLYDSVTFAFEQRSHERPHARFVIGNKDRPPHESSSYVDGCGPRRAILPNPKGLLDDRQAQWDSVQSVSILAKKGPQRKPA